MDQFPPPFETMVFVCTHQRAPGERVACANPGRAGAEILDALRKVVQESGLNGKVRICKSGCLDRCEEGPNVLVVRNGKQAIWLKNLCLKNVNTISNIISTND